MKKLYRFDVSKRKGGLLVYVNKNISSKYLRSFHLPNDIQAIPIEVHLKQRKLLVISIYRPPDQKIAYFLSSITDLLDHYLKTYRDFIVIGDFNESETNPALDSFLDEQKCKNVIKNKTCFKTLKGSYIDLILTSRPSLHQFTNVFETGISDHHLLIYTVLKSTYTKMKPKVLSKRCFKNFSEQSFLQDLKQGLSNTGNFSDFNSEFKNTLNNHAPIKTSKVRDNIKPHANKNLRKEIMKRSNLKNIANKSGKTEDKKRYKIQLKKNFNKAFFKEKLPKGKDIKDFWNICKP